MLTIILNLICFVTTSFGQKPKLLGTWVTKAGEQMIVDDPRENRYNFLTNSAGISKNVYLQILNDTLCFHEDRNGDSGHGQLHYDLAIISKTDSTLELRPCSVLSSKFFNNKPILQFTAQPFTIDQSIRFEKLIYHMRGSWFAHNVDLEIDKNKSFYLSSMSDRHGWARRKQGHYNGMLSDSLYKELIWCLQTCNLRQIRFDQLDIKDTDEVTLIVYFNGIRRYLRSNDPPHMAHRLFHLLESIYDYAELKPTWKRILEE
ncbi:hypothetical protein [Dyadobacter sp. 32]|uniref:hypothetical protein n=1 Tax=Dyadobacter sp. 32 TaxID=538966 RepID=UPI0011F02D9D